MSLDLDHDRETPGQAARQATGIPSGSMYRLPVPLLEGLDGLALSDAELRLLHVLFHVTCRKTDDWYRGTATQPEEGYAATCTHLRQGLGLEGSNDNRAIRAALAGLAATGLFETLAFRHRNRKLAWRFTERVFAALFDDQAYGLFDIRALRVLPTRFELDLYARLAVIRRMNAPRMVFRVEELHALRDGRGAAAWGDLGRPLLGALQKIAGLHDLHVVLLLDWAGRLPGIDTITLRLRHDGSSWRYRALQKTNPDTVKVIVLGPTARAELTPAALPEALQALRRTRWDLPRALPDRAKTIAP